MLPEYFRIQGLLEGDVMKRICKIKVPEIVSSFIRIDPELSKDMQTVLDFATASSCLCHSIEQDINYVTREDVLQLMASGGHGTVSR